MSTKGYQAMQSQERRRGVLAPEHLSELQKQLREFPGQGVRVSRSPSDEPDLDSADSDLIAYASEAIPGFRLIGPARRSSPFKGAAEKYQKVFVSGDLTGNGLEDYVAVMVPHFDSDEGRVIAFLRQGEREFSHHTLQVWTTWHSTYLVPTSVGGIKARWTANGLLSGKEWKESFPIPSDRFAVFVCSVAGSHYGFFMSSKGPKTVTFGCEIDKDG